MSATAILNLSKAGFTEAQVTALAEYFDSQMATKADIAELHIALERVRADLGRDIGQLRADVDVKIAESKTEIIKWVVGLLIAQGAAIIALMKLLPGAH